MRAAASHANRYGGVDMPKGDCVRRLDIEFWDGKWMEVDRKLAPLEPSYLLSIKHRKVTIDIWMPIQTCCRVEGQISII